METKLTEETRVESDLIGAREIPAAALYGVQTLRGIENFLSVNSTLMNIRCLSTALPLLRWLLQWLTMSWACLLKNKRCHCAGLPGNLER